MNIFFYICSSKMKTSRAAYYLIVLLVILLAGCADRDAREKLSWAHTMLEENLSDSAANLLDSIYLPERMGKEYHMDYLVTRVQAKYKAYRDVKGDTAVLEAVKYYEKQGKNKEKTAQAYYTMGCVLRERGENKKAITYFKKALNTSLLTNDYTQQGLCLENLAYIYDVELLKDQAIRYYKKAYVTYLKQKGTERKQINVLNQLAINFILKKNVDSAFLYYEKQKKIAIALNDSNEIVSVLNNIGVAYNENKQYNKSVSTLNEALNYRPITELKNKINHNIARSYIQLKQYSLAKPFIQELLISIQGTTDLYYKSAVLTLLTDYEKQAGNYKQALAYSTEKNQLQLEILETNQSKALIEAEKEFDYTEKELEAENAKLIQRNTVIFSTILVVLLVMLGLTLRKKGIQEQKSKETKLTYEKNLKESENKALSQRLKQFTYSVNQYKTLVTQTHNLHDVIYRNAEAGWFKENSGQFRAIIQALKSTEDTVINNMGEIAKTFLIEQQLLPEKIMEVCSGEDLILLHRLYTGDTRNDIAALFRIKPHTLTQRVSRLKEKLKPLLSDSDFKTFFH